MMEMILVTFLNFLKLLWFFSVDFHHQIYTCFSTVKITIYFAMWLTIH